MPGALLVCVWQRRGCGGRYLSVHMQLICTLVASTSQGSQGSSAPFICSHSGNTLTTPAVTCNCCVWSVCLLAYMSVSSLQAETSSLPSVIFFSSWHIAGMWSFWFLIVWLCLKINFQILGTSDSIFPVAGSTSDNNKTSHISESDLGITAFSSLEKGQHFANVGVLEPGGVVTLNLLYFRDRQTKAWQGQMSF